MNEGFVINGGQNYYCTEKCRNYHLDITDKEWEEEWYDDEGDSYYTDWDGEDLQSCELIEWEGNLYRLDVSDKPFPPVKMSKS